MHWHHKQPRGEIFRKYNNQTNDLQFHFLTSRRLKWYELCFQYPLLCAQHNNVCPWKWKIVQASISILTISNLQTLVLTFASDTPLQMYLRILQSDRWCGIDANKYNKILNVSKAPYFTRKLWKKENKMHVIINNVLRQNYTACNSKQHRGKPWQDCFSHDVISFTDTNESQNEFNRKEITCYLANNVDGTEAPSVCHKPSLFRPLLRAHYGWSKQSQGTEMKAK